VPFADTQLLALAATVSPGEGLADGEKTRLRAALRGVVPEPIRIRRKSALPKDQGSAAVYQQEATRLLSLAGPHLAPGSQPAAPSPMTLSAFGMNLHAATTADGRDRKQLERICRYLLRPPFAHDAVTALPGGRGRCSLALRALARRPSRPTSVQRAGRGPPAGRGGPPAGRQGERLRRRA